MSEKISESGETAQQRFQRWQKHLQSSMQGYCKLDTQLALKVLGDTADLWHHLANLESVDCMHRGNAVMEARVAAVRECVEEAENWERVTVTGDGDRSLEGCGDLPDRLLALIGEGPYAPTKEQPAQLPDFRPINCSY